MMGASPEPDNLPAGTWVDGWRVVRQLGSGAYGTVYCVEKGGQLFALKLAHHREASADAAHTDARAQRELSCLLVLKHPHIARVWGHGRWLDPREGYFYLVMDYVEGFTLAEWVEQVSPTPHEVVVLMEKVAEALAHMHGRGVFHRDLKPTNLLVRKSDGEPVVVDYGAAHFPLAEDLTDKVLPPGTPRYTSPEATRFAAEHRHNPAARYEFKVTDDIYALGVTLYDVLTDPQPKSRPRRLPVSSTVLPPELAHEVNGRVPVALGELTDRLMARAPEQRPVSAQAARRQLAELVPLHSAEWVRQPVHPPSGQAPPAAAPAVPASAAPLGVAAPEKPRRVLGSRAVGGAVGLGVLLACATYLVLRGAAPVHPEPPKPVAPEATPRPQQPVHSGRTNETVNRPPPSPLAGSPLPEPALPAPAAPQEKGPPVKPANPAKAVSAPLCSQKQPPPRGTSAFRAWCQCAGIVGTVAAFEAGCSGPQVKPTSAKCPPEAIRAMEELGLVDGQNLEVTLDKDQPGEQATPGTFKDGPITGVVYANEVGGKLIPGTLLFGQLWTNAESAVARGDFGVMARYTHAQLPGGGTYLVCIESAIPLPPMGGKPARPGENVTRTGPFEVVWRWRETRRL